MAAERAEREKLKADLAQLRDAHDEHADKHLTTRLELQQSLDAHASEKRRWEKQLAEVEHGHSVNKSRSAGGRVERGLNGGGLGEKNRGKRLEEKSSSGVVCCVGRRLDYVWMVFFGFVILSFCSVVGFSHHLVPVC